MTIKRLKTYLFEANKHKEHILEAKSVLNLPVESYEKLSQLERFGLNTLIFRFSKLQDLLGTKIFRTYLDSISFPVDELSFFDILKEIEKEGIIDIDSWNELRTIRNDIAHEYPQEINEMIEKINVFVHSSDALVKILEKLEKKIS